MWNSLFNVVDEIAANSSLSKRLSTILLVVLGLASIIFLGVIYSVYRADMEREKSRVSYEINEVLREVLENAMLKRDLDGLKTVVNGMARQPGIVEVNILNKQGEVRFSSQTERLNQPYPIPLNELCEGCSGSLAEGESAIFPAEITQEFSVIRSVNVVANKPQCGSCHGSIEDNPVNGVLVVDYDASSIQAKSRSGLAGLVLAGLVTIGFAVSAMWFSMRRYILEPVARLNETSRELSRGQLDARVDDAGQGELAELGSTINTMAENLQISMKTVSDSESYLQSLIDADPDGIRVIDSDYRVVKYNRAYQQLVEHSEATPCCYQSSHGRDTPCVPTLTCCPLYEIKAVEKPVKTIQTFVGRDGEGFATQVYSAPLRTASGDLMIIQSIRDMRNDIKVSQEHRLAALGQLAAGVGHEILNPLNSIRLALKSTLSRLENSETDCREPIEYMRLVDGEIDRCIDVTKRLKKLSALPDERDQLVDVNLAVSETASLLQYEAENRNIELHLDLAAELPRIYASEANIRTVILNLIQNAYHAMPEKGELKISTTHNQQDELVEMEFSDTGEGISEEDMPYMLNPFYSNRANGERGMGLGLPISLSIIEQHNGNLKLNCTNAGERGARIEVTFPVAT